MSDWPIYEKGGDPYGALPVRTSTNPLARRARVVDPAVVGAYAGSPVRVSTHPDALEVYMTSGTIGATPESFSASVAGVGLTTGLQICLDAADINSYDGSAQQWSGTGGTTMHFNRGTGSGSDAADPGFSGTPGALSVNEFFTFNGSQYFTLVGANPAWVQTLHQASGKGTYVGVVRPGIIGTAQGLCGTGITAGSGTGFAITVTAAGLLQLVVTNAGSVVLTAASTIVLAAGTTYFIALSWDSMIGVNGILYRVNGVADTDTSTYSSPSVGNATNNMTIGTRSGATGPLSAGSRYHLMGFWDVALTGAQLDSLYARLIASGRL